MNRSVAVLSLLAVAALAACNKQAAPSADVWATVNGKEIRKEEVDKYYRAAAQEGSTPSLEEANTLKLNVLDSLIEKEILLERAQKLGLEATDGEVEDKFTESKSPFTEDEFQRQLKERGMSVDDLKRELRRQISIQKLINREVLAKISITDQDISDFYNKNRGQFNVTESQFRVAQIVVTPKLDPQLHNRKGNDAASDPEAQRKIRALYEQIRNGADFSQVAMDYSEDPATVSTGGDLGYVPESSFAQASPELRKVVMAMKVGDLSNVIASGGSYRILKLIAREAPGQRELADPAVQQVIRDGLRNRKEQLIRAAFLTVARGEAKVENYLARQILESTGKLPEATPAPAPAASKK
ncbi:MAG: SurA N-terminal domain-containing protein [Acidobacteria bacterium]|nr:SurA N-terminal domain-containing protein [Acidobacteriota bacterium]